MTTTGYQTDINRENGETLKFIGTLRDDKRKLPKPLAHDSQKDEKPYTEQKTSFSKSSHKKKVLHRTKNLLTERLRIVSHRKKNVRPDGNDFSESMTARSQPEMSIESPQFIPCTIH